MLVATRSSPSYDPRPLRLLGNPFPCSSHIQKWSSLQAMPRSRPAPAVW